ncbi:MAG: hypothetical protein IKO52_11865 [Clostridia bacterium]|nr:hypothetical protein [Clostridia bacterium]
MMERKKYGWTVKGILGLVFSPMGLLFLILGISFWYYKAGSNPEDPQIFLYVFGGMGAAFFLVGLSLLLADVRRRALQRRAYEGGYYVMAKIAGVHAQKNVNMNGMNPVVVECHYQDPSSGVVHIYRSRYLYMHVDGLLQSDQVPVYIDRMNEDVGFVDIDAVLPAIKVH